MGAYKPLDQGDVARDLAARIFRRARRSTRGGRPLRGKRLLALKTSILRYIILLNSPSSFLLFEISLFSANVGRGREIRVTTATTMGDDRKVELGKREGKGRREISKG